MGRDLAEAYPVAADLFRRADEVLGRSLTSIMWEGPDEELTKTANCQPALFVHGLALLAVMKERVPGLKPVAAAGLSLGEMTAHTAAGTFSFEEGLKIVAKRGELMDEACAATDGSMAAMIGGEEEAVVQLAEDCGIDVANFNCPGQVVVSGVTAGVEKAVAQAKERGLRMGKKLKVAGAYHSRLMASAEEKLGVVLAGVEVGEPGIPVVTNHTANVTDGPDEVRATLTHQVTGSVRWVESMQRMRGEGHDLFLELGPGKVLAGLMARIDKEAKVVSADDAESLEAAVAELA